MNNNQKVLERIIAGSIEMGWASDEEAENLRAAIASQSPKEAMSEREIIKAGSRFWFDNKQLFSEMSDEEICVACFKHLATSPNKELVEALAKIANWEVPPPAVMEDGTTISYAAAYGSNGVRDYMRAIANDALKQAGVEVV